MDINWYIEISNTQFKNEKYLRRVNEIVTPYMNYFFERLIVIDNYTLEDANSIFSDIIKEMPIMSPRIYNGRFFIEYNKHTHIYLKDTVKQIYREIKLDKIL
jgi:hypothetical protein